MKCIFGTAAASTIRRVQLSTVLVASLSTLPSLAQAQIEVRYASAAPPGSIFAKQVDRLATEIGEETKGAVKVNTFHNSQLGGEIDVINQIVRGRLDMGGFAALSLALQVPEVALLQMPFYFDDVVQRDCVLDNHAKPVLADALEKKGLKFLTWGESGAGQIVGKKAYTSPTDVRGIKAGIYANKGSTDFWKRVGANPVPTTTPELASSLQTGLIDSWVTVPVFYVPSGLNKIAPVMTKLDMSIALTVNVMNKKLFDGLAPDVRAALERGVGKTPLATVRKEIRDLNEVMYKMHTDGGGTIATVTPAQRAEWQKGMQDYWIEVARDVGPAGEKMLAVLESGKKACKKG